MAPSTQWTLTRAVVMNSKSEALPTRTCFSSARPASSASLPRAPRAVELLRCCWGSEGAFLSSPEPEPQPAGRGDREHGRTPRAYLCGHLPRGRDHRAHHPLLRAEESQGPRPHRALGELGGGKDTDVAPTCAAGLLASAVLSPPLIPETSCCLFS